MAKTGVYTATAQDAMLNAFADLLNGGTLEICTAGFATVLATFTFNNPSEASVSSGVLTFDGFPKTVAASASGTAAVARYKNSSGTVVYNSMTVATSGGDINLDNLSINSGQNVTIAASPTHKSYGVA